MGKKKEIDKLKNKEKELKKQKEKFYQEQKKKVAEYKQKKQITEQLLANATMDDYGDDDEYASNSDQDELVLDAISQAYMQQKGQKPPAVI